MVEESGKWLQNGEYLLQNKSFLGRDKEGFMEGHVNTNTNPQKDKTIIIKKQHFYSYYRPKIHKTVINVIQHSLGVAPYMVLQYAPTENNGGRDLK